MNGISRFLDAPADRPRRVLYTLPDGAQVAALLRTDLFRELTADPDIHWAFLSSRIHGLDFREEFAHPRVELRPLSRVLPRFFDRQLEFLRRELVFQRLDPVSVGIIHRRMKAVERKRYYLHRPVAALLGRVPGMDRLLAWMQRTLARDQAVDRELDALDPDVVVLGSGAVKFPDVLVGRWARKRGKPLFGIIPSWDNLAIKGPTVRADRIAVWSRLMRQQATDCFGYRPEQVAVTGPPLFDRYASRRPSRSRRQFLGQIGFDPERRLITYTTMPPFNSDFAPRFVHLLAGWIERDRLAKPAQLLVRLHPQDNPVLYQSCRGLKRVRLELPGRFRATFPWQQAIFHWDPTGGDLDHLRDTLEHSDVVINIASTMTLEAVAMDCPVVNLAYNPPGSRWPVSIAEYYRLAHYRPVAESGAVRLAHSDEDLREAIDEALLHPERRRARRRLLREQMTEYTDGRCAARLASEILHFVHGPAAAMGGAHQTRERSEVLHV